MRTPEETRNPRSAPETTPRSDGWSDGRIEAAFRDVLDEALSIVALPSARLELSMRVRRARPAPVRTLLLHAMVRHLHERSDRARRVMQQSGIRLTFADLFPELPIVEDDALLLSVGG